MRCSLLITLIIIMSFPENCKAQDLNHYRWKNRLLLLVDTNPDTDALISQLAELTFDSQALKERDLIIFRVTPDVVYLSDGSTSKLKAKKIYEDCGLDPNFKGTLLLGKDGGVKLEEPFEVSAQSVFNLIDRMPMRRTEIRNSGKN